MSKEATLDTAATLSLREGSGTMRAGGSRTLDDVEFLDQAERDFYDFEWWRHLMESNRPVAGIAATNRDWMLPDE